MNMNQVNMQEINKIGDLFVKVGESIVKKGAAEGAMALAYIEYIRSRNPAVLYLKEDDQHILAQIQYMDERILKALGHITIDGELLSWNWESTTKEMKSVVNKIKKYNKMANLISHYFDNSPRAFQDWVDEGVPSVYHAKKVFNELYKEIQAVSSQGKKQPRKYVLNSERGKTEKLLEKLLMNYKLNKRDTETLRKFKGLMARLEDGSVLLKGDL